MFGRLLRVLSFRSGASLPVYLLLGAAGLFGGMLVRDVRNSTGAWAGPSRASIENGRVLAGQYCQSCHLLPDPAWLTSRAWAVGVLPHMAPRLGIYRHGLLEYEVIGRDEHLAPNVFPSQPMLTGEQWQSIIDYYVSTSPESLPPQDRPHRIQMGLSQFSPEAPRRRLGEPVTSMVKIVETGAPASVIVSNAELRRTEFFDHNLNRLDGVETRGGVVDVEVHPDGSILTCNIGLLRPVNEKLGSAQLVRPGESGQMTADPASVLEGLARPVQVAGADFNNDGRQDYLVCEFGFINGSLALMEGRGDAKFKRHDLIPSPGATKVYLQDHDRDGDTDFWALFGQALEGVFLFTNNGRGGFHQEKVLSFAPVNGSTYFELVDFDADGHQDILYTCGDNGDATGIFKPYHGVYIFTNDGRNRFEQKYFFPINGCSKGLARDFDGDGDLDIATISFYADYPNQPEEGFVYLRNEGGLDFRPFSLEDAKRGRWMTMDAGDVDRDGDVDLVLGNCSTLPGQGPAGYDWKRGPAFLLLRNNQVKAD